MNLPQSVMLCITRLQQAGFAAYAVGGCVRDSLLGLTPHDYDLCTSALPEQISRVFSDFRQIHNGEKHGTVAVIIKNQVYEITTFRTEGDYQDSRHPGWVKFVPQVEQDLARRDFTVNAMACSPTQGIVDPFGGRQDLQAHILRAVGDPQKRFREDALRILRGVRFSVRFGLTPEENTLRAMESCAPLMKNLASERVFEELCKLLPLVKARDLIRFAPILTEVIPELKPSVGFDQRTPYHKYDVYTHIAWVVENTPCSLPLRWAALLHDVGKPASFTMDSTGRGHFKGHAEVSAQMADGILRRLKSPTKLREEVLFLIAHHMIEWEPERHFVRRRLGKYGVDRVKGLLALQIADYSSKGTGAKLEDSYFPALQKLLEEALQEDACLTLKDLQLSGSDLIAAGFLSCPGMGKCLSWLLEEVQEERIPNEKQALLAAAADVRKDFFP